MKPNEEGYVPLNVACREANARNEFKGKMKGDGMWIWVIIVLVIFGVGYIQLAPSDPKRWHTDVTADVDKDFTGGAVRIVDVDLIAIDAVIRKIGAKVLSGSVDSGHITYISRSRIMGFPDYITVQKFNGKLRIYSRSRFGQLDLGVNKRRVEGWLLQL